MHGSLPDLRGIIFRLEGTLVAAKPNPGWQEPESWNDEWLSAPLPKPRAGIPELVTACREKGIQIGVITSLPRIYSVRTLLHNRWGVEVVVGEYDKIWDKPNLNSVQQAHERLGLGDYEVILVSSNERDIETGKDAGVKTIAALWGTRRKKGLTSCEADIAFDSVRDLHDAIVACKHTRPLPYFDLGESHDNVVHQGSSDAAVRILHIEREAMFHRMFAKSLAERWDEEQFWYYAVDHPDRALSVLAECKVDIILSSQIFTGINGVQFALVLWNDTEFSSLPIIFATASDIEELLAYGLKPDTDNWSHLHKPFRMHELPPAIVEMLERCGKTLPRHKSGDDASPSTA